MTAYGIQIGYTHENLSVNAMCSVLSGRDGPTIHAYVFVILKHPLLIMRKFIRQKLIQNSENVWTSLLQILNIFYHFFH